MKTLYDSFRDYVAVETLEGDNKYQAEGYGLQDAKKGIIFQHFPPVLHLQLKRFEYDIQRDAMVKVRLWRRTVIILSNLRNRSMTATSSHLRLTSMNSLKRVQTGHNLGYTGWLVSLFTLEIFMVDIISLSLSQIVKLDGLNSMMTELHLWLTERFWKRIMVVNRLIAYRLSNNAIKFEQLSASLTHTCWYTLEIVLLTKYWHPSPKKTPQLT